MLDIRYPIIYTVESYRNINGQIYTHAFCERNIQGRGETLIFGLDESEERSMNVLEVKSGPPLPFERGTVKTTLISPPEPFVLPAI